MLYFPELLLLLQWQSLLLSNQPQQLPESDDEIISHPRPAQLNPAGNPGWRITELNNPKIMEIGKDLQDHQVEPSTHHNHGCETMALSATCPHFLYTSKDGDSTISMSSGSSVLPLF